jgi:thymidylate synthase
MMIQDIYRAEPWKMLVCCIMLNQTSGVQVKQVMRGFFDRFPTLDHLIHSDIDKIADEIKVLGLQNVKAERIKKFATECYGMRLDSCLDVSILPGLGHYAEESMQVFVRREIMSHHPVDKEIFAYVRGVRPFSKLKEGILNDINEYGEDTEWRKYETKELINYMYSFDDKLFCKVTDHERLKYVNEKLETYRNHLDDVATALTFNRWSRQAVIQFEMPKVLPNCTVSVQFQRRREKLLVTVFQRSQDIEKLEMDCEIFARMALEVIKKVPDLDGYAVDVFVGNMHRYLEPYEKNKDGQMG